MENEDVFKDLKYKYNCVECGNQYEVPYEAKYIRKVQNSNFTCISCSYEIVRKKNRERREKNKGERVIKTKTKDCLYCGESFTTNGEATYCSSTCRKKGMEKKKFYNGLKIATREANMADVHILGQGKYVVSTEGLQVNKKRRK